MDEQQHKPSRKVFFREKIERMRQAAGTAFQAGYLFSYNMGVEARRWLRALGHCLIRPAKVICRAAYKTADFLVLRQLRAIREEARRFGMGFSLAAQKVRDARKRSIVLAALQALALPFLALRRHRKALACIGNLLMPVAAALVLVFTVQYWSNLSFGLSLEYEGESFGTISNETVFDSAAAMVSARVCETDDATLQVRTPKLTLTVLSDSNVLDEATVCDKIIRTAGDEFAESSGLYLEGELVGTMTSGEELNALLDERLAEQSGENRTVEFVQSVKTQDGLYPISLVRTADTMRAVLNAEKAAAQYYTVQAGDTLGGIATRYSMTLSEIQDMNGIADVAKIKIGQQLMIRTSERRLQVRSVEVSNHDETVTHPTRTEYDSTAYEGTRTVKQKGADGLRNVTIQTVAVDGVVQSTTELSSTTLVEAKEEVVVIGTKKKAAQSVYTNGVAVKDGDGVSTGSLLWPVPAVHSVSQYYRSGHTAIDIANGPVSMMNQAVVAADGGIVKEVVINRYSGYGIYVAIDHGNGITTLYAHLNSVSVTTGQPVSRGQEIGRAGSTGRSTGPHLHFEVRVNGRCVNPLNYVS